MVDLFSRAANNVPQIEWLKQQKCIVSPIWRLEVRDRGVGRAMLPVKTLGKDLFKVSLSFR